MAVLVTGGAGYIGSHTCLELLEAGYEIVALDNLMNSNYEALRRVERLTGKTIKFYQVDLLDRDALEVIFQENPIEAAIHLAGLKAVGESVMMPLFYYHNNITGTLLLFEMLKKYGVSKLVFSSSATVYGRPQTVPVTENFPLQATNPYGMTKLMIEQILQDLTTAEDAWSIAILRYFNPIGAHESGMIGEDPKGMPNNLLPFLSKVAIGYYPQLQVYGNDFLTSDGTGVRDYIHVVDLAKGHVRALQKLYTCNGAHIYNLGTGQGYSVLEMVRAFEMASGKKIPYTIAPRRPGDIGECYADPSKSWEDLQWKAEKTIMEMCRDAWNWQTKNPEGYRTETREVTAII
ncbi:UDP-glucose 4-epimerase GalE [Bacillus tianshenii]|uniref:UDP-glucose 4-epimerase GalE n=1 Tax=Sutcliffiella tianshenii TaxID=1463404 RepID=UPI001CD6C845|nr:UDP-glucose 4-epimerase GalE [Bacillus tianshenii]MCA1320412.1 UDP-glucose 4-epimerase GalE [Bacillus tianshenii]